MYGDQVRTARLDVADEDAAHRHDGAGGGGGHVAPGAGVRSPISKATAAGHRSDQRVLISMVLSLVVTSATQYHLTRSDK